MKFAFVYLSLIAIIFSCTDNKNAELIKGEWSGTSWTANGAPASADPSVTSFNFDGSGKYNFTYGKTIEEGTYKVENDMLFTKPSGQTEIMVRITKLEGDTLVFEMNRSGSNELLTLQRKR